MYVCVCRYRKLVTVVWRMFVYKSTSFYVAIWSVVSPRVVFLSRLWGGDKLSRYNCLQRYILGPREPFSARGRLSPVASLLVCAVYTLTASYTRLDGPTRATNQKTKNPHTEYAWVKRRTISIYVIMIYYLVWSC